MPIHVAAIAVTKLGSTNLVPVIICEIINNERAVRLIAVACPRLFAI